MCVLLALPPARSGRAVEVEFKGCGQPGSTVTYGANAKRKGVLEYLEEGALEEPSIPNNILTGRVRRPVHHVKSPPILESGLSPVPTARTSSLCDNLPLDR